MIDETGWWIIACFVLFLALLVTLPVLRHRQWRNFALRRGGTAGSIFGQPSAEIQHRGRPVAVKSVGRDELSGIVVTLTWPDQNLQLECRENQWLSGNSRASKKELEEVETGDAEFDEAYRLFGNEADEANKFFGETTRRSFLRLYDVWTLRPTLSIENGELRVYRPHSIWTCDGLTLMIEPLLEFYDVALANYSESDGHHETAT